MLKNFKICNLIYTPIMYLREGKILLFMHLPKICDVFTFLPHDLSLFCRAIFVYFRGVPKEFSVACLSVIYSLRNLLRPTGNHKTVKLYI